MKVRTRLLLMGAVFSATVGFVGKFLVFGAAINMGFLVLALIAVFTPEGLFPAILHWFNRALGRQGRL